MKRKKLITTLIILGSIAALIGVFEAVVNIIPPSKVVEHNVFLKDKDATKPMLAAHRGGSMNNPENTLKAYKAAVTDFNIDIVESDIWLTKDEKIVFSHDGTIDRMSDIKLFDPEEDKKHEIIDYTLEELENFNFVTKSCSDYGFLGEQVNNETLKPAWVIGLTWSHAMYIIVLQKLKKLGLIK